MTRPSSTPTWGGNVLEVRGVQARYGDAQALWGVDLDVAAGEMVCIVGPNGAGKTTLVKTIAGLHPAAAGSVRLDGVELTALPGHRVCDQAVATVPEGRRVFGHMTVRDNLLLGAYRRAARQVYRTTESEVYDLFPRLARAFRAVCGQPLRRGAADARHRPRPDGAVRASFCSTNLRSGSRR